MSSQVKRGTASALFGKARQAVLALLFTHTEQSYYLRQIARATGVGYGAVQRELANLTDSGIITRTARGNYVFYQANKESPIFPEIHGLVIKTVGVADVLRGALAAISERIDAAFVFGSVARGSEKANSDVDVMVIGSIGFGEVVSALRPAQDQLAREVNPSVFSAEEVRRRIREKDYFISRVLKEEKVFLIGDERDLRELG